MKPLTERLGVFCFRESIQGSGGPGENRLAQGIRITPTRPRQTKYLILRRRKIQEKKLDKNLEYNNYSCIFVLQNKTQWNLLKLKGLVNT